MSWRSKEVTDVPSWVIQYAARRYGSNDIPLSVQKAWLYLLNGAYQFHWSGNLKGMIDRAPDFSMSYYSSLHAPEIAEAWLQIVTAANEGDLTQSVGPLQYDVVDFGRQVLVNLFVDLHAMYVATYNMYTQDKVNTSIQLDAIRSAMLQLFDDLDMLLASNTNFLLGHWIADARASVPSTSPKFAFDNAEFNARNQITMWGPDQNIEDYASKEWAGLVKDYYKDRWALFTGSVNEAVREGKAFDHSAYEAARFQLESKFSYTIMSYPTTPVGNPFTIAKGIIMVYLQPDTTKYVAYEDTDAVGNDILADPAWNNLVGQLAFLCDVNPDCVGFNDNGYLKRSVSTKALSIGTVLFVKITA